ncbi:MAG TPA: transporter [Sphingomonas sp.]|jgi:hypothetical protein|uniref:transporter n=1 Tax=Sphingomonas sp. TaxID=28214 RepID=UPI002ED8B195
MMAKRWFGAVALLTASPAWAQAGPPRFCPNRPDLGASSCTVDPGRLLVEVSGIDWQRDDGADTREDSVLFGDFQARIGVDPRTEVQFSWTPYGHARVRDKATGRVSTVDGIGDVRLGLRRNLRNPDGSGLSIAIEPFVRLPAGRDRIGAGDWGGGVVVPVNYELSPRVGLAMTAELDAAVDGDGNGRHPAYSAAFGIGYALTDRLGTVAEVQIGRDDDPAGGSTLALGALSLVFQPREGLQVDLFAAAGLNRSSPDLRLLTGAAFLF